MMRLCLLPLRFRLLALDSPSNDADTERNRRCEYTLYYLRDLDSKFQAIEALHAQQSSTMCVAKERRSC